MAGEAASQRRETADAADSQRASSGELVDVECPICYQEYNQDNRCPQMLECLHAFCSECLHRIIVCQGEPAHHGRPPFISCPLCRHHTPLDIMASVTSPSSSSAPLTWPTAVIPLPLPTVTEGMTFFLEGNSNDTQFIILPTVSLRVQQIHQESTHLPASGLARDDDVIGQGKRTVLQVLAVTFWVLFIIACVVAVVFGPHFLNRQL
ncbi:E3 ubiquitin-protein ligase RNF183 [Synchiropus picturatus]